MVDISNDSKVVAYSKIAAHLIGDALSVSITLVGGYAYFIAFKNVSPLVKIPIMMLGNRLIVIGLNKGEKLIKECSKNIKA